MEEEPIQLKNQHNRGGPWRRCTVAATFESPYDARAMEENAWHALRGESEIEVHVNPLAMNGAVTAPTLANLHRAGARWAVSMRWTFWTSTTTTKLKALVATRLRTYANCTNVEVTVGK